MVGVKLVTNTAYQNPPIQWWWVVLPLGIALFIFLLTAGLEFYWARGVDDTGGIAAAVAAPVNWAVKATNTLVTGVGTATGNLGRGFMEGTGVALSGPFKAIGLSD